MCHIEVEYMCQCRKHDEKLGSIAYVQKLLFYRSYCDETLDENSFFVSIPNFSPPHDKLDTQVTIDEEK